MHSTMKGALNKMLLHRKSDSRAGMSLIEVVLAIAVAGFILTAATSFVVSVSSIWSTRAERHFFEDHVDGVMQFMQTHFDRAGIAIGTEETNRTDSGNEDDAKEDEGSSPPNADSPKIEIPAGGIEGEVKIDAPRETKREDASVSLVQATEDPIRWERLPGASNYEDPLLSFELNALPPLLNAPAELPQLGGVRAFLQVDREHGLRILWHPLLQEEVEDSADLRSTQISALVQSLEYIYWDERLEEWEVEAEPKKGDGQDQFLLPRYLRFTFVYEEVIETRSLALPVPSRSVFIF